MAALQPAVKKECKKIIICVTIGCALTILAFFVLNLLLPGDVPFDYTVITGSVAGGFVAFMNFYLMCLTVQKVAADPSDERARNRLKLSYTYRYLMQIGWMVIAILVPCFNPVAGIVPLIFPSFGIKLWALFSKPEPSAVPASSSENGAADDETPDAEGTEADVSKESGNEDTEGSEKEAEEKITEEK